MSFFTAGKFQRPPIHCCMIFTLISSALISGCADYRVKNPIKSINVEALIDRGPSLNKFMTKYQVLKKWGCPDRIELVGNTPIWGAPIECWTYYSWLPDFPVNYRNVSKEYKLFFQGEILTDWKDTEKKIIKKDTASETSSEWPERTDSPAPTVS